MGRASRILCWRSKSDDKRSRLDTIASRLQIHDEPPLNKLALLDGLTPLRAMLLGAGFILIAVKLWVITLGAPSIISEKIHKRRFSVARA